MMTGPDVEVSASRGWRVVAQALVFVALLVSNVAQRVTFKTLGYSLGAYPYFVLLSISAAFVPIFGIICASIIAQTGGFLPETRTWRCLLVYVIIGCCNAVQGLGMVFANPYVAGYLQTLLQQGTIPFTFLISLVALRVHFSVLQYVGVLLISVGLLAQFAPDIFWRTASGNEIGEQSDFIWPLVFLLSQVPVAIAAVLQEQVFSDSPVNPFLMMFWASASQFTLILLLSPLVVAAEHFSDVSFTDGLNKLLLSMLHAWEALHHDLGAARALLGCIFTMLSSQLAQAFMVKVSSAAFAVLCLAFVVPASAAAFSMHIVMGPHAEQLDLGAEVALVFVFAGIAIFQSSSQSEDVKKAEEDNLDVELLPETARQRSTSDPMQPPLCVSSVGMIYSGYTDGSQSPCSVWEVRTLKEHRAQL